MTRKDFGVYLDAIFADIEKISGSKGVEYANSDDQLANFKRLGDSLGVHPTTVAHIFLHKHLDSIGFFVKSLNRDSAIVLSEPIRGRILDAILYLALLGALVEETVTKPRVKA